MIDEWKLLRCQERLAKWDHNQRLKIIYEWTKTGFLSRHEFCILISAVFSSGPITEDDVSSKDYVRDSPNNHH